MTGIYLYERITHMHPKFANFVNCDIFMKIQKLQDLTQSAPILHLIDIGVLPNLTPALRPNNIITLLNNPRFNQVMMKFGITAPLERLPFDRFFLEELLDTPVYEGILNAPPEILKTLLSAMTSQDSEAFKNILLQYMPTFDLERQGIKALLQHAKITLDEIQALSSQAKENADNYYQIILEHPNFTRYILITQLLDCTIPSHQKPDVLLRLLCNGSLTYAHFMLIVSNDRLDAIMNESLQRVMLQFNLPLMDVLKFTCNEQRWLTNPMIYKLIKEHGLTFREHIGKTFLSWGDNQQLLDAISVKLKLSNLSSKDIIATKLNFFTPSNMQLQPDNQQLVCKPII